jgi:IS5 family transposase
MSGQIIMIGLEDLVQTNHVYRKFSGIWDFSGTQKLLEEIEKDNNYKGCGINRLFKCLVLQFLEDLMVQ